MQRGTQRRTQWGPESDPPCGPYLRPWPPKSSAHPLTIQLPPALSLTPLPTSLTGAILTCKTIAFMKPPTTVAYRSQHQLYFPLISPHLAHHHHIPSVPWSQ